MPPLIIGNEYITQEIEEIVDEDGERKATIITKN